MNPELMPQKRFPQVVLVGDPNLLRVRPCDGACCKQSPRWPTKDAEGNKTCKFLSSEKKCLIKLGQAKIPKKCPAMPHLSGKAAFEVSCKKWPQNMPGRGTGDCCLQWDK